MVGPSSSVVELAPAIRMMVAVPLYLAKASHWISKVEPAAIFSPLVGVLSGS